MRRGLSLLQPREITCRFTSLACITSAELINCRCHVISAVQISLTMQPTAGAGRDLTKFLQRATAPRRLRALLGQPLRSVYLSRGSDAINAKMV